MDRREMLTGIVMATGITFVNRGKALADYLRVYHSIDGADWQWEFFESGGQILFSMYGASGTILAKEICWIIRKKNGKRESIGIEFPKLAQYAVDNDPDAVKRLVEYKINQAIRHGHPVPVDLDGGELPLPEKF